MENSSGRIHITQKYANPESMCSCALCTSMQIAVQWTLNINGLASDGWRTFLLRSRHFQLAAQVTVSCSLLPATATETSRTETNLI